MLRREKYLLLILKVLKKVLLYQISQLQLLFHDYQLKQIFHQYTHLLGLALYSTLSKVYHIMVLYFCLVILCYLLVQG